MKKFFSNLIKRDKYLVFKYKDDIRYKVVDEDKESYTILVKNVTQKIRKDVKNIKTINYNHG